MTAKRDIGIKEDSTIIGMYRSCPSTHPYQSYPSSLSRSHSWIKFISLLLKASFLILITQENKNFILCSSDKKISLLLAWWLKWLPSDLRVFSSAPVMLWNPRWVDSACHPSEVGKSVPAYWKRGTASAPREMGLKSIFHDISKGWGRIWMKLGGQVGCVTRTN